MVKRLLALPDVIVRFAKCEMQIEATVDGKLRSVFGEFLQRCETRIAGYVGRQFTKIAAVFDVSRRQAERPF